MSEKTESWFTTKKSLSDILNTLWDYKWITIPAIALFTYGIFRSKSSNSSNLPDNNTETPPPPQTTKSNSSPKHQEFQLKKSTKEDYFDNEEEFYSDWENFRSGDSTNTTDGEQSENSNNGESPLKLKFRNRIPVSKRNSIESEEKAWEKKNASIEVDLFSQLLQSLTPSN